MKPGRGQRRERRTIEGELHLRCWGELCNGVWHHASEFSPTGPNTYAAWCKACRRVYQAHRRNSAVTVDTAVVEKWIWEIAHRCGSINNAARTIGVPLPTVYKWLGRYRGNDVRRMRHQSAQRVLRALMELRRGERQVVTGKRTPRHTVTYVYGCRGCAAPLTEHTPGCLTCRERHYRRSKRAA